MYNKTIHLNNSVYIIIMYALKMARPKSEFPGETSMRISHDFNNNIIEELRTSVKQTKEEILRENIPIPKQKKELDLQ